MRNHDRNPCGVRTHDPEVAKQTPYPLGHRSPNKIIKICNNDDANNDALEILKIMVYIEL